MKQHDTKKEFDDLFAVATEDDQFVGDAKPPNPDALLIEAVLLFYRELGLRPSTIQHVAAQSLRRHSAAMRAAMAHVLKHRLSEREIQDVLGRRPGSM